MEALEFSSDLKEQPVVIKGKSGTKNCVLKEMDGTNRDVYLNGMKDHMEMVDDKMTVTNYSGLHAMLLKLCLYEGDALVSEEYIQSLPASTQNELFKHAQLLNGLTDEAEVVVKKD